MNAYAQAAAVSQVVIQYFRKIVQIDKVVHYPNWRKRLIFHSIIGTPKSGSIGFGALSVNGRNLVPSPAQRIPACRIIDYSLPTKGVQPPAGFWLSNLAHIRIARIAPTVSGPHKNGAVPARVPAMMSCVVSPIITLRLRLTHRSRAARRNMPSQVYGMNISRGTFQELRSVMWTIINSVDMSTFVQQRRFNSS